MNHKSTPAFTVSNVTPVIISLSLLFSIRLMPSFFIILLQYRMEKVSSLALVPRTTYWNWLPTPCPLVHVCRIWQPSWGYLPWCTARSCQTSGCLCCIPLFGQTSLWTWWLIYFQPSLRTWWMIFSGWFGWRLLSCFWWNLGGRLFLGTCWSPFCFLASRAFRIYSHNMLGGIPCISIWGCSPMIFALPPCTCG